MSTRRKTYSKEFKLEAVRLAEESGNRSATARDLDIYPSMIRRWKAQFEEHGQQAFPGKGNPRDEELARLQRRLRRLEEENAIGVAVANGQNPTLTSTSGRAVCLIWAFGDAHAGETARDCAEPQGLAKLAQKLLRK